MWSDGGKKERSKQASDIDGALESREVDTRDERNPQTEKRRHSTKEVSPKAVSRLQLDRTDVHNAYDGPVQTPASSTSDRQYGPFSPSPGDRVFPIRSVVSVDPTQTPAIASGRTSEEGYPGFSLPNSATSAEFPAGSTFVSRHHSRQSTASEADQLRQRDENGLSTSKQITDGVTNTAENSAEDPSANSRRHSDTYGRKASGPERFGGGDRMQIFTDTSSDGAPSERAASSIATERSGRPSSEISRAATVDSKDGTGPIVTARFKHTTTEGGHAVITGRDGDTLQRCEDEPIHIPGAIQSFGLLVALEEVEEGELIVRTVSENSKRIIGYTPQELFKLASFTDILTEEQTDNLLDHIDFIRDDESDPASNGPEVFTLSVRGGRKRSTKLWCAMHINPVAPDLIILEFELDDDQEYPLSAKDDVTPEPAEDTLNSNPTEEEYAESTENQSKPLRVLRSARKRRGEAAAMEVFSILSQITEQLAAAPNLEKFLKILVGVVKELTGFHRVMIYQFDSSFNGRVVTELVDPRATKDLYKGLNFPASDIPKQARELYKYNKVRLLYDRDQTTARLVCRTMADLEKPLDLTYSYLRAMSPIHIKYLTNMAVRSSMSVAINAFGELWGLIACHSYGARGMRVSFPIRKMCRLVGDTASRQIERLSYASRLQARKLINTVPTEVNPSGRILASSDELLKLFDADFGMLSIRGETKILGRLEQSQEALALLEYLRMRQMASVVTSVDVKEDFPDLRYPLGFAHIAGLLLVPLSVGGNDFIVFFRKSQIKEVKWAGNPYEKFNREGTEGYLEPRKSFKMWTEKVVGKCRDWTEEQVETAAVLCLVYGKFIEVWRQKEAALQNSQLTKLLLANSAHEVRTPLNAIINYLEIAMEGSLDQETRENLAKSHSASKSLIYVINDLLDLTKTEEGQQVIKDETFDLPLTIRDAVDSFRNDAKRKGIDYDFVEHPGVPQHVHGDSRRIRQAVTNILGNAFQYTTKGFVRVQLLLAEQQNRRAFVEFVVEDSGCGMSDDQLDSIFRELEEVSSTVDDELFSADQVSKTHALPESGQDPQKRRVLGLGLAVVGRIVGNMHGQMRLKSEVGKGSRFVIQLPFEIEDGEGDGHHTVKALSLPPATTPASPPPVESEGERMMINGASTEYLERRCSSIEEANSIKSIRSSSSKGSVKSEADRLIDAISEPLSVGLPESEELKTARANTAASITSGGGHRKSVHSLTSVPDTRNTKATAERPAAMQSKSFTGVAPQHIRSSVDGMPGQVIIQDSKTQLKAIRMPDEFEESSPTSRSSTFNEPRAAVDVPAEPVEKAPSSPRIQNAEHLQVLIAEDDPVNSKIITRRLERLGHHVFHTINGEECASAYGDKPAFFDVVLMDMQVCFL